MTSTNSPSETLWSLLHDAGALLTDGGFAEACPPMPTAQEGSAEGAPAEGYADLAARHGAHLGFGETWPTGQGSSRPQALILCAAPLSPQALAFLRTWFENPRVNLVVADSFYLQPLPVFTGEATAYAAFARDLCQLFRPKALLSLGPAPAQKLLGAPLSLDSLRGSDYRFDRWSMVTTLDPEKFAGLAEDDQRAFKGQVWKDLQRLLGKLRYG